MSAVGDLDWHDRIEAAKHVQGRKARRGKPAVFATSRHGYLFVGSAGPATGPRPVADIVPRCHPSTGAADVGTPADPTFMPFDGSPRTVEGTLLPSPTRLGVGSGGTRRPPTASPVPRGAGLAGFARSDPTGMDAANDAGRRGGVARRLIGLSSTSPRLGARPRLGDVLGSSRSRCVPALHPGAGTPSRGHRSCHTRANSVMAARLCPPIKT